MANYVEDNIEQIIPSVVDKYWCYDLNEEKPSEVSIFTENQYYWRNSTGVLFYRAPLEIDKQSTQTSHAEAFFYCLLKQIFSDAIHRAKVQAIEMDIYIPSINVAIEYDGSYYHKDKLEQDLQKNIQLNELGIYVIRIRERKCPQLTDKNNTVIDCVNERNDSTIQEILSAIYKHISKKHISVIIFFSLTLLSCVCGAIFALLGWSIVALIGMVGEIVFGIIFYNCSEKYQIEFCVEEYDKYTEYCSNLHKWLEKFNKQRPDEIRELYDKIQAKISRMKTEEENSKARGDRWLQTLIIPAIIAIITAIITKQENIGEMITYAFAVVILFAVVYGIIAIIKSISFFPQKRRIEQMECFASDLQGVLDFINSNAKKKQ